MLHQVAAFMLNLSLTAGPASPSQAFVSGECISDGHHLVDSVVLPGGGKVETVASESSLSVNFYMRDDLVLSAVERDGEAVAELTEVGLALGPERAAELIAELEAALPDIMAGDRCTDPLSTKTDEKLKCGLIGVGVGLLTNFFCPGPCAAAAGTTTKLVCDYIVDKACEQNSKGC